MNATGDPPRPCPGAVRGRGAALCALAAVFLLCLGAPAPADSTSSPSQLPASMPDPPAVGTPAPDFPLGDLQNTPTTLQQIVQDTIVVLVFYIGYT